MTNTRAILSNYLLRYILLCIGFITAHYVSAHLYVWWCVPFGVKGYVMSPFLTLSPHCQFLRWVTYNGGVCINACWVLFGSWLISKFQYLLNGLVGANNKKHCVKECVKECDKECVKESDESEDNESEDEEEESKDNKAEEEECEENEEEDKVKEEINSRTKLRTLRNRLRYKKNT